MSRIRSFLGHYRLDGHEPVPVDDIMEWARWFETADRSVAKTELPGGLIVSTVFLGLDHSWFEGDPPALFETMVFSDYGGDDMDRYATWDEAVAGHEAMVAKLKGKTDA